MLYYPLLQSNFTKGDNNIISYLACSCGLDKVVQLLLEHDVQVNVQDKVSSLSFVHFKLSSTTQYNNVTFVIKAQMSLIICL